MYCPISDVPIGNILATVPCYITSHTEPSSVTIICI